MTKKKKSNFRDKTNRDAQKQQKAGSSYGYLNLPKGVNVFSPEPGSKTKLDFMPYEVTDTKHPDRDEEYGIAVDGDLWYKRPFKIHRNVGVDQDAVVCLSSIGKKCPICEYKSQRAKNGADKDELDSYKASSRNLYVIIPIDSKKHDEEIHIMDISQWLFQNLLNDELEEDEDRGCFPELEDGQMLKVRWDSKTLGKGKPFAEASRIDFYDRDSDYEDSILDDIPNLDEVLSILTYQELDKKFQEIDDDDDDEDEKPKKRKKKDEDDEDGEKPKRTRRKKEEKEEDEEDEKPKRRKKKNDDDEDEKPKKSRKKKEEKEDDECPHGHTFGDDCDKKDECETCDSWNDCAEAQDNA